MRRGNSIRLPFSASVEALNRRPDIARLKCLMPGFPPFMQDTRDQFVRADPDIARPDDEIMCGAVIQIGQLVGGDPGVLMMPAIHELAHGGLDELRQIPGDEPGVFPGKFDLAAEGKGFGSLKEVHGLKPTYVHYVHRPAYHMPSELRMMRTQNC